MKTLRSRPLYLLFVVGLVCSAAGCGGSSFIKVKGTVVENGAPIDMRKWNLVVSFHPVMEGGGDAPLYYMAVTKEDGTFTVPGDEGKGIPAGKYKVAVTLTQGLLNPDKLNRKFNPDNTLIVREVSLENPDVTIDIATEKSKLK